MTNCEDLGEKHELDDDCVRIKCGHDACEAWHLNPERLAKIARDNEY